MAEDRNIEVIVANDGKTYSVAPGTTLMELAHTAGVKTVKELKSGADIPVFAALVDHKVKSLSYGIALSHEVEFIGYSHPGGRRTYIRSLVMVLQKAARDIWPDKVLVVDHSLPSGLYCEIREQQPMEDGRPQVCFLTDEEVETLQARMGEIIAADLPFGQETVPSTVAKQIFRQNHQPLKVQLQETIGAYFCDLFTLDGMKDTMYGATVPSTGYIKTFGLTAFAEGFCLQLPIIGDSAKLLPMKRQSKIAGTLSDYSDWCAVVGVRGVGTLNKAILSGQAVKLINLSEALHERKYAAIADQIYARRGQARIVMIAGPSSSGKTSTSLRIALQCSVLGMNPKVIELDNYFLNREQTPKDENGEYDFESLYAMDLEQLNKDLNALLAGEEVEIPKFDFKSGTRKYVGNMMRLEDKDILIMEGIHALNPEMTSAVDNSKIFRVFASALTSLNLDENNSISTSDNRLIRRMVRDNRVRGISPEDTILRWHSVRRGEARNIFPFQENADAVFNSALLFELPMLKYYADPLLRRIPQTSPAYTEAARLLKFLGYIVALSPAEIEAIPPTSIMREFIGGQTL